MRKDLGVEEDFPNISLFIDISAAYDNVIHDKLLRILKKRVEQYFDPVLNSLVEIMHKAYG